MAKRAQIEELYYIRAIAAFGIFMIHATGGFVVSSIYGSKAMHLGILLNQFFRFGTPIFMMISGLVLFYNYRTPQEFNYGKFLKKKGTFILIPYIVWSVIYYLYSQYVYGGQITALGLVNMVKDMALGNIYAHLYFIFLIFQFYLLYPLLLRYLSKYMNEKPILFFCVIGILQGAILVYEYYFKDISATGLLGLFNKYYWKTVFGWFFYFLTGGILALHYHKIVEFIERNISKFLLGFGIASFLYIGQVYLNLIYYGRDYYDRFSSIRPTTMVYAVFTMPVLLWLTRKILKNQYWFNNIVKSFGTYSLGVYFAHPLVLECVKILLMRYFPSIISYSRVSSIILIAGLGWILVMGFNYFIASFSLRWMLVGKVPKFTLDEIKIKELA